MAARLDVTSGFLRPNVSATFAKGNHEARPRGFTLLELLVVVVIIAILVGISVPVFAHVKESGNRAQCMSNLRQLHAGCAAYAADNNGQLPIGYRSGIKQFNTMLHAAPDVYPMLGQLWTGNYIRTPQVFYCPSETAAAQAFNTTTNPWPPAPGAKTQGGYACNPLVDWSSATLQLPRLNDLTGLPLLADGCGLPDRLDSRHRTGVNVLYANGSVRWVPRAVIKTPLNQCSGTSAANNAAQTQIWQLLANQ
jgi:prepilin-type N-terminal cleavage/methylation domain-containing protein